MPIPVLPLAALGVGYIVLRGKREVKTVGDAIAAAAECGTMAGPGSASAGQANAALVGAISTGVAAAGTAFGIPPQISGMVTSLAASLGLGALARSAAANKNAHAVLDLLPVYDNKLQACGITDPVIRSYIVHAWGFDLGNRARNGLSPWPGKVPFSIDHLRDMERARDAAAAQLQARAKAAASPIKPAGSTPLSVPVAPAPYSTRTPATVAPVRGTAPIVSVEVSAL